MSTLTIYTLASCDSCRRAVKWLRNRGIDFVEKPIRVSPPTLPELRGMLAGHGGELRRLCNTSGREYRDQKLGERLPAMTAEEVLLLLATNGSLIKRPFVTGPGVALTGFDEETWTSAFSGK